MSIIASVAKAVVSGVKTAGSAAKVVAEESVGIAVPTVGNSAHVGLDVLGKSTGLNSTILSPADLSKKVLGAPEGQNFRDMYFARRGLTAGGGGGPSGGSDMG